MSYYRLDESKQKTVSVPRAYWEEEPLDVAPSAPGQGRAPEGMQWLARVKPGREECYLVPEYRRVRLPDGEVLDALDLCQQYEGGQIVVIDRRASTVTVQMP